MTARQQTSIPVGDLLGPPMSKDYAPSAFYSYYGGLLQRRKPLFSLRWVHEMLRDPRVRFGLWLIKGPIVSNARFFIKSSNPQVKEFLINTVTRFWRTSAARALRSIEWGAAPAEVLYRIQNNQVVFDNLKDLHPLDCRIITLDGKKTGVLLRRGRGQFDDQAVYIGGPKSFWHVQGRDQQPWYGTSRLLGAFGPWLELNSENGAYDIRRLYYHKYAYRGERIRHPVGETIDQNGVQRNNAEIASEIVEKMRTGHVVALPNTLDERGNYAWIIEDPNVEQSPTNVLEYIGDLRNEIWEGMGIPTEIVSAEGTGAFAGRRVPQQAFYSLLQEILLWLISDADEQIFRPLIAINFGIHESDHEIIPFPLLREVEEASAEAGNPAGAMDPALLAQSASSPATQPAGPQQPFAQPFTQPSAQPIPNNASPIWIPRDQPIQIPDTHRRIWREGVGNGEGVRTGASNGTPTQASTTTPRITSGNGWAQVEPLATY